MNDYAIWIFSAATVLILLTYEILLILMQMRVPDRIARSAHAYLREEWFAVISEQAGSEILAVQTLRNSLMSATMTASTAVLGLVGSVTLVTPSLRESFVAADSWLPHLTPRLMLELILITMLFASSAYSAMAVRYYNHAGFICAMPVGSAARIRWTHSGAYYVRQAGILYGRGLRHLIMVAPLLAAILHPFAGPIVSLLVVMVLMLGFDRIRNRV